MREAVANETQATLLDVLLDGVEGLLFGDLHLCVRPSRYLNNHVEDAIVCVGKERDVVEGGDDCVVSSPLNEDTVLYRREVSGRGRRWRN